MPDRSRRPRDPNQLGKLVVAKVQLVEGITRTVSCTVVHL